jgi:hypothetical protein
VVGSLWVIELNKYNGTYLDFPLIKFHKVVSRSAAGNDTKLLFLYVRATKSRQFAVICLKILFFEPKGEGKDGGFHR